MIDHRLNVLCLEKGITACAHDITHLGRAREIYAASASNRLDFLGTDGFQELVQASRENRQQV